MSKVKQKQESRRAEIILSATKLMEGASFDEISVQQICEAAGISVGSFYHYFQKKSDILIGLLLLADEYQKEHISKSLVPGQEAENLKRVGMGFAEFVLQAGMERAALSTYVTLTDTDLSGEKRPMNRTVEEIIQQGQQSGAFTTDYPVEELAACFLISMRGVVCDWARRNNSYDLRRQMRQVLDIFLRGISAGGELPQANTL
jgi:AcrR family transcriptional regulator